MKIVSVCPLRVASLEWQTSRGVPVLTVVAKATYHLAPVTCPLSEEQEDPNEYDSHWNYDAERSLHSPSDLVPYKPRPEVTLVGQTFAPRGEPVARLTARIIVGRVDKSIVVHAPRSFSQDGVLRHGPRFNRMPLRWERAAGGPETANPVGVAAKPDTLGAVALPNLEPPALNVTRPDDSIEPVGFGPIAADWPARQTRLGRHAGSWSVSALRTSALPDGIDPAYFLSAPPDQWLDELRANERMVLENLHPDHPRLVTSLPGYEPRAFVQRPRGPVADLPLVCDTLWIDTDRSLCTLTWRGQLTLESPAEEGRVVVAMQALGRPLGWSTVEEHASAAAPDPDAPPSSRPTEALPPTGARRHATTVHTVGSPAPVWPAWLASKEGEPSTMGGDPPYPPAQAPPADVRLADVAAGGTGTMDAKVPREVIDAAIARAESDRVRAAASVSPLPVTPWAVSLAAPSPSPQPTFAPVAPVSSPAPVSPPQRREAAPSGDRPAIAPAREPAREHVDLLWFDPVALPRILADEVLGQGRPERPAARWIKEALPREPQEAKDRREILAVVSRGKPVDDPAALDQVATSAYRDDGTFTSPLVLVAGGFSFDFDEVENLRAILTVVTPFLAADKKLREVAGGATEALKAEGRLPGDVAAGFTRRIEEAFAQGQRSVAPGYLDGSVERILLEARRYAKKTLFGEPRLRALLAFAGGSAPLPTYLPESLATRLPLFRRFKARAVVELRPQEDQYETHPDALLVLALGRVLRRGGADR